MEYSLRRRQRLKSIRGECLTDRRHRPRFGEHVNHHIDVVGHSTEPPPSQSEVTMDHPAADKKPRVVSRNPVEEDGDVKQVLAARTEFSEVDPRRRRARVHRQSAIDQPDETEDPGLP